MQKIKSYKSSDRGQVEGRLEAARSLSTPAILACFPARITCSRSGKSPLRYGSKTKKERQGGWQAKSNPVARKGIKAMDFNSELNCTGSEFNFTGKALTLADLEQAAIRETHEPLSGGARESWEYSGFDRDCEWKAVLTGSEAVLVTDESRDLNVAGIYPDMDTFILWLEQTYEERQNEAEKERRFREQLKLEPAATSATSAASNESTAR